ncbi:MAG TPA: EAL domain-containing protein [Solirubrobacteraceae bacterium]|nr:EAL domain-containing protein [Solirubrobacteraceae bacterium]
MTHSVRGPRLQASALLEALRHRGTGQAGDPNALVREAIDPLALMQRVADQALAMIEPADGVLIGVMIDPETLRYVCGAGYLGGWVGEPLALEGSLSGEAIRSGQTLLSDDTELDGRANKTATRAFDVRSSICVPLGRGVEHVGIINVSSAKTHAFGQNDVALLSGLAEFMSAVIGAAADFTNTTARLLSGRGELAGRFVAGVLNPEGAEAIALREDVEQILAERDFTLAFQPIFSLERGEPLGAEALVRFDGGRGEPPDVWLARAHRAGLGVELELAIVSAASDALARLPRDTVLTINAGPDVLASGRLLHALGDVAPGRIVLELTEHLRVEDYPHLAGALGELRGAGVRLAIDDAGAGFASLTHILRLAPDYIKLDRQLTRGIDNDTGRRCLANSLARFAEETGASMIAEGIESAAELDVLQELGIAHGQGFYLARPGPIGALARAFASGGRRVRHEPAIRIPAARPTTAGAIAARSRVGSQPRR